MSMISAQCDELRKAASKFGGYQNGEISRLLHDAADTISELRDDLQGANAENAKLREACAELLHMAETAFPEWLHWPEMYEYLRELGVEVEP